MSSLPQKREKKRHESILTDELVQVIEYLNQYLPPQNAIKYVGFDMARVSKRSVDFEPAHHLPLVTQIFVCLQ